MNVARALVETSAVSFRTEPFFVLTSGTESPIYVDNRRLLAFPAQRRAIVAQFLPALLAAAPVPPGGIAGTATAGIPWAAWIADRLDLPMLYVRSAAKEWGHQRAVEGAAPVGASLCVVEDLAFTAGSVVTAAEQLRAAGYEVPVALTVVTYDIPAANRRLADAGLRHVSLTTIDQAVAAAAQDGLLDADQAEIVTKWLARMRAERQ